MLVALGLALTATRAIRLAAADRQWAERSTARIDEGQNDLATTKRRKMRCVTKLVAEAKVGRGTACHGEAANPLVRLLCACLLMGRDIEPDAPGRPDNDNERGSGDTGS